MVKCLSQGCLLALLIGFLGVAVTAADEPAVGNPPESSQAAIARLEALLAAQQQQLTDQNEEIETLRHQLVAADAQDQDAARTTAMKQQIREVLSEQEFRESLMPSMTQAGFDNGFFIRSSDDKFMIKFHGALQFRWTYYGAQSRNHYLMPRANRDDRSGFDLQRVRVAFDGYALTPDLTYNIEVQADAPAGYNVVAWDAWGNYRFSDELQIRFGCLRVPSTRQQSVNEKHQQFVDRPVVDAVFGFGRSFGVELWGRLLDKRLEYYFAVVNGLADGENVYWGRTITNDPAENDGNPALLFRTVWHALGDDPENDFMTMDDLARHASPALDVGFHYAFTDNYGDTAGNTRLPYPAPRRLLGQGGFGLTNSRGLQLHQFGLDAGFKWQGFSATGEYIVRVVDVRRAGRRPFAPWWMLTRDGSTTAQHGAYMQLGYFLPIPGFEEKIEAVARVGGVSALANTSECTWEYGAGVNYYIAGHAVKLQADVMKVIEAPTSSSYSSLANVNDDPLVFRVQVQMAF